MLPPPWAAAVSAKKAGVAEEVWAWAVLLASSSAAAAAAAAAAALDSDSLFSARSEA